jgi:hypothetical protein
MNHILDIFGLILDEHPFILAVVAGALFALGLAMLGAK